MTRLRDKKIIVTGGSRGIGAAIVQSIAQQGGQVAFSYASREEAAQEVLQNLPGEGHFHFPMDISDETSVLESIKKTIERLGGLYGLVNNAGITCDQLLLRMKTEDFDKVVNTNLRGAFLCTKSVMKTLMRAKGSSIVNITSVIGLTGNPGQANYAASKAGVVAFSKSIAQEVASRKVRVNCVAPGFIQTDMTNQLTDGQQQEIKNSIPSQELGTTEDVANATVFLLSDESKYITGHTLNVNGGMLMV